MEKLQPIPVKAKVPDKNRNDMVLQNNIPARKEIYPVLFFER